MSGVYLRYIIYLCIVGCYFCRVCSGVLSTSQVDEAFSWCSVFVSLALESDDHDESFVCLQHSATIYSIKHTLRFRDSSFVWVTWWRHQMETFSTLLALSAGNSLVTGEFPAQRPVTRSCDVFFDLRLNKQRWRKQSWGWWFETSPHPLWRHCNDIIRKSRAYVCGIWQHKVLSLDSYFGVELFERKKW